MKRSNEKIARRKMSFLTHKMHFFSFYFLLFGPLLLSKLSNFLISRSFLNYLKCYRRATFNSRNGFWTLIATKQHPRNFFERLRMGFVLFNGLFLWVFDSLLLWGAVTFSILIFFWRFLMHQMCQWERFKFCLDTRNNRALKWSLMGCSTLPILINPYKIGFPKENI
jgi:hypothetical protein